MGTTGTAERAVVKGKVGATLALIGLLALLLAGCGDDDDGGLVGGGGGSEESFCDDARALDERFSELEESEEFDVDLIEAIRDELSQLNPPDEIQDDFDTLLDGLGAFVDEFGDADLEDPAVLERVGDFAEEFEEVDAASDRVSQYLVDECGITSE